MRLEPLFILFGLFFGLLAHADICPQWSQESQIAELPNPPFHEVSGIAASKQFPHRFYLINDSGDGPQFYWYSTETGEHESIHIKGFKGWDIEAISVGPCGNDQCIYIADIGDNLKQRQIVRIAVIKERANFPSTVSPLIHKIMTYPDGAHDAEAMIVTQSGDVYIFSKEMDILFAPPSSVFKTSYSELRKEGRGVFKFVGKLQVQDFPLPTNVFTITDAALSPDESRLIFLTYFQGVEMDFDSFLEQAQNKDSIIRFPNRGFPTRWGAQSEAITYAYPSNDIVWTYESHSNKAPLIFRSCVEN